MVELLFRHGCVERSQSNTCHVHLKIPHIAHCSRATTVRVHHAAATRSEATSKLGARSTKVRFARVGVSPLFVISFAYVMGGDTFCDCVTCARTGIGFDCGASSTMICFMKLSRPRVNQRIVAMMNTAITAIGA